VDQNFGDKGAVGHQQGGLVEPAAIPAVDVVVPVPFVLGPGEGFLGGTVKIDQLEAEQAAPGVVVPRVEVIVLVAKQPAVAFFFLPDVGKLPEHTVS